MFAVLFTRNGDVHAVSYRLNNGNYRTICGKNFPKSTMMNTLASDNTFPGICSTCKSYYDEMYLDDLEYDPRLACSESSTKYNDVLEFQRFNIEGPKARYEDLMDRHWQRLVRYQRLAKKSKKK